MRTEANDVIECTHEFYSRPILIPEEIGISSKFDVHRAGMYLEQLLVLLFGFQIDFWKYAKRSIYCEDAMLRYSSLFSTKLAESGDSLPSSQLAHKCNATATPKCISAKKVINYACTSIGAELKNEKQVGNRPNVLRASI